MEKVYSATKNKTSLKAIFFLPMLAILFLLQSCCMQQQAAPGASRNCNCGGNKSQHALNNKPVKETVNPQSLSLAAGNNNNWVINPGGPAISLVEGSNYITVIPDQADQPILGLKTSPGKKLPLGIKAIRSTIIAGPNVSFRSSKQDYGSVSHKDKMGVGFQFGFGVSYVFSSHFAVSPALIFKHNNAAETFNFSAATGPGGTPNYSSESKSTYSYNYLSVPILAEFSLSDYFTVMAGPEVNVLLGAKLKSSGSSSTSTGTSENSSDIKKSSATAGIGVQAGIKYSIPGSPIGIQLLYDQRISRQNKDASAGYSPGYSYSTPATHMGSVQAGVTCAICELLKKMRH